MQVEMVGQIVVYPFFWARIFFAFTVRCGVNISELNVYIFKFVAVKARSTLGVHSPA